MKILVTGNNGFVASELHKKLESEGHEVIGFDNFTNPWIDLRIEKEKIILGDVFNGGFLNYIFRKHKFDVCYHLAARISVDESLNETEYYIRNNFVATVKLVDMFFKNNPDGQFIFASTSEVYGSAIKTPMDINHPTNPQSPYAVSKLAADRYLNFLMNAYNKNIKICRMFNTFGEKQGTLAFIPLAVFSAIKYGKIFVYGDGNQYRDYIHVDRVVKRYYDMILESPGIYNFGTGRAFTVNLISKMICDVLEKHFKQYSQVVNKKERIGEVSMLVSSESCFESDVYKRSFSLSDLNNCIYNIAKFYLDIKSKEPNQWELLTKMVDEHYKKIGVICE